MLWLVIKGAKSPALDATASSSAAGWSQDINRPLELHDGEPLHQSEVAEIGRTNAETEFKRRYPD